MEITREHKEQLKKIIDGMTCSKDFKCLRSDFEDLGEVKDIGMKTFLECLEEDSQQCEFAFPFGYQHFCKCPVRIYLAKNLKI